ncbi:uncharacterized protein LOC135101179 isoform X3 [Scylla paramamosain]|uniref:uncharacterized protein LOC135101179 isoform X3 n=1 Tax=Scylla paramamosain TaxID=85552 RepID=UPI003083C841
MLSSLPAPAIDSVKFSLSYIIIQSSEDSQQYQSDTNKNGQSPCYVQQTPPEARNCQSSTSQEALLLGGKKNSPFRKIFDHSLQKMCESGLMNKLRTKWLSAGTSTCGRKTKNHSQPL